MESAIELRQLRAFLAMLEQGSVTAAAQSLGLAQSTVSEALSSLERAVGAAVFLRRRGSHDLVLTAAGEALLPHARSVLASIDAAHVAIAGATTSARGRVAIATNESLSSYVLAGPLDSMRRNWPSTTFEVSVMMCSAVRSGVEAGEYDVGLMLQPADDQGDSSLVVDRSVVSDNVPLVIFAQPSHPLASNDGSSPAPREAFDGKTLYLTDASGSYHQLVRRFLEHDGMSGPRLQPTGSVEGVKRAVLGDARAVGMLPAYALLDEMRAGRVVSLSVLPSPPRMRLEALTSRTRAQHPAARELLASVRSTYAPARPVVAERLRSNAR